MQDLVRNHQHPVLLLLMCNTMSRQERRTQVAAQAPTTRIRQVALTSMMLSQNWRRYQGPAPQKVSNMARTIPLCTSQKLYLGRTMTTTLQPAELFLAMRNA